MNAFRSIVEAALVQSLWQNVVAALLLWAVLSLGRLRSPNVRYVLSCVALAGMVATPVATATILYVRAAPVDPGGQRVAQTTSGSAASGMTSAQRAVDGRVARPVAAAAGDAGVMASVQPWLLPLWTVGVLVFSLRLVGAGLYVRRLSRQSRPAGDAFGPVVARLARRLHVKQPVRILISSLADGPATLGWLRPIILLPPAMMLSTTPQQLEALLAHELAHIRRHDYLINVLQ